MASVISAKGSGLALVGANPINVTRLNRPRDWQTFERLTRDLFTRLTGDVHTDLNGRSGQPQSGVDVSGVYQTSRKRVGVQCKGRDDGTKWTSARLTAKALRLEVQKARNFYPKLDIFVLLTTGPNDARLKRTAAELTAQFKGRGDLQIEYHGWDWIEAKLSEHLDLATNYGLITMLAEPASPPVSKIAKQIAVRLLAAIELMNDGSRPDNRCTLQNISKHLGLPDWRQLEAITEARSEVDAAQLVRIAKSLGINEGWLIEGKDAPFAIDPQDYRGADEEYGPICQLNPQRIIFVRERQNPYDSIIAVQVDEFRWVTFRWGHPTSGHVGGTGRRQLFEYCCLIRRLFRDLDFCRKCSCYGQHLDAEQFRRLQDGEIYPGALFRSYRNDHWWMDFAELADERLTGTKPHDKALRDAIHITRGVLAEFQEHARQHAWMRTTLQTAGFPLSGDKYVARFALEAGLHQPRKRSSH